MLRWMICSLLVVACSSQKKVSEDLHPLVEVEHKALLKDFEVREASSNFRPAWIEDAERWAKENEKEIDKFRFFSYETTPKLNKTLACDLAKASLRADIASEVSTFIQKTLGQTLSANGATEVKEYIQVDLTEKIQATIYGASIIKTYWEAREYKGKEGEKIYTCAILIRMERDRLKKTMEQAVAFIQEKSKSLSDEELKDKISKNVKELPDQFLKSKKGE